MDALTNSLQSQQFTSQNTQSSPLDEMLKSKGVMPLSEQEMMEEDVASKAMTIANFSPQSIVMSNAQSAQGGLLQSVMASASTSGAETSTERTQFGKQAANNLMQTMEKDAFEQNVSSLLEGLRTDLEEKVEETINEENNGVEETIAAAEKSSTETVVESDGTVTTTTNASTDSTEAAATAESSETVEAATTQTSSEAPAESAKATPTKESVDVYV